MNLSKTVDTVAIVLLLALVGAGFMVMQKTAESNKVTADIALIQSQNKTRVIKEVGLLSAEMRNLQKDIDSLRTEIELRNKQGDMAE